MTWGENLDFLEEMRDDGRTPQALEIRPILYDWMVEYLKAFDVLSATRQCGMGPNPIQLSEMLAYMQLYEVEDRDTFVHHILQMDKTFLEAVLAKQEANKGK